MSNVVSMGAMQWFDLGKRFAADHLRDLEYIPEYGFWQRYGVSLNDTKAQTLILDRANEHLDILVRSLAAHGLMSKDESQGFLQTWDGLNGQFLSGCRVARTPESPGALAYDWGRYNTICSACGCQGHAPYNEFCASL